MADCDDAVAETEIAAETAAGRSGPFGGMTPLDDALARLAVDYACAVGTETVGLKDAAGRILAENVVAGFNVPPSAASAMDGYGLSLAGLPSSAATGEPLRFTVVGRVPAGSVFAGGVEAGQAVRIFTGAAVPAGVDAVAIQEECRAEDGAVVVPVAPKPGDNIRPAGEDMAAGAVALQAGARLRPQEIGMAAALGRRELTVRKRLRVALFSTGDELREPGDEKPPGAVYDANRYGVGALLTAAGCDVCDLGILPDRREAVRAALESASGTADLIVATGGMSVGEEDHVKDAVNALGRLDLWRLALKPGKPLGLGRIGDAAFLGLPGNPVSALIACMLVGRPLALRLGGAARWLPTRTLVVADFAFRKKPGRREFLRVWTTPGPDGRPLAKKFANDSSGVLTSMVEADGLLDVPAESVAVNPGDLLGFYPFVGAAG